jgi:hypothetical protein
MADRSTRWQHEIRDFSKARKAALWRLAEWRPHVVRHGQPRLTPVITSKRSLTMIGLPPLAVAYSPSSSATRPTKPSKTRSKLESPAAARGHPDGRLSARADAQWRCGRRRDVAGIRSGAGHPGRQVRRLPHWPMDLESAPGRAAQSAAADQGPTGMVPRPTVSPASSGVTFKASSWPPPRRMFLQPPDRSHGRQTETMWQLNGIGVIIRLWATRSSG